MVPVEGGKPAHDRILQCVGRLLGLPHQPPAYVSRSRSIGLSSARKRSALVGAVTVVLDLYKYKDSLTPFYYNYLLNPA